MFGRMHYVTTNARNGIDVVWENHVVPALRISENSLSSELYLLDPSISEIPLTKSAYHENFSKNLTHRITGYVTCESDTYHVNYDCFNPEKVSDDDFTTFQDYYLLE